MNRNVLVDLVIIVVLSVMAFVIFSGGPATRDVGSPKAPSPPAGSSTAPPSNAPAQ